ncbi:MAG: hypothetical protein ACRC29_13905 [Enterobacterales bacterium]
MQANQNVTTNPTTSNPANQMGGIFRMKREIKKLKAELAATEELVFKNLEKLGDERQRVQELLAEKEEVRGAIMKASHRNLDYQKAVSQVEAALRELDMRLFNDWKELDDCFMRLAR